MRLIVYILLFCSFSLTAQTFNGGGGGIPDDGNSVDYEILVSGLPTTADTLSFGIESVCLNITHSWVADLAVALVAPDGTVVQLFSNIGGDTDGFVNTCLSGNTTTSIFQVGYPFTGTFRPFGDMGFLNNKSLNPNGVWKLHILDTYPFADVGDLLDWNITFGQQPCKPFAFESSDLPIIKINTNGQVVPNEPKIEAYFQLIDNGSGARNYVNQSNFAFESKIGLELRGFSSQGFPKKSYGVELRDDQGEDLEVSLLGLPKTSDFALQANFTDKTLMRNALAYEMFRQLGHYATRTRFCEVVVDNIYQGIYILTEKIKRGNERVDVAKLTPADTTGTDLTGGYMLRVDWNTSPGWNSQYSQPNSPNIYTYFQHVYPRWDALHPSQMNYIRSYVDSFEVALHGADFQDTTLGWRNFADEKSFIDYLILNEISKNVDGYRLSTYFHKNRDDKGGKLTMGPPWDYDLAWYNADYCENFQTAGWAYDINYVCGDAGVPFWWEKLASDTLFAQNLACRWQLLRHQSTLSDNHIFGVIDSMATILEEAQRRNFRYWPILGQYVWPNPGPLPTTYAGEVDKLKTWLNTRLEWLDFAIAQRLPTLNAVYSADPLDAFKWQFTATPGYQYAWDFGDGAVSSEAAPLHQFPGTGTYTVQLTVSTPYGCSAESQQIFHIVSTGASEAAAGQFQVWPNPAGESLRVKVPEQWTENATLHLLNPLGQVVREAAITPGEQSLTLALNGLSKGIYCLDIQAATRHYTVRVAIE